MREYGKCCLLMGTFYALHCMCFGYLLYYLGYWGMRDDHTGYILAGACLAGSILQLASGRVADRYPGFYWKKQLIIFGAVLLAISLMRIITAGDLVWECIIYSVIIVIVLIMMPLVNTACFYYEARGRKVNFGVARGVGSVTYAVVTFIAGRANSAFGIWVVTIFTIAAAAAFLVAALLMPGSRFEPVPVREGQDDPADVIRKSSGRSGFFRKYPVFVVVVAGVTFMLIFHNIFVTYLIRVVENVGGGTAQMGTALAIASISELPMLFLYSRISGKGKLSSSVLIIAACAFFVVKGVLFALADNVMFIYATQLLQSVSFGLLIAAKATYTYETVDPEDETTGQSVMSMTDSLGAIAGSLAGGVIMSVSNNIKVLLWWCVAFAVIGTIIVAAGIIAGRRSGRSKMS